MIVRYKLSHNASRRGSYTMEYNREMEERKLTIFFIVIIFSFILIFFLMLWLKSVLKVH